MHIIIKIKIYLTDGCTLGVDGTIVPCLRNLALRIIGGGVILLVDTSLFSGDKVAENESKSFCDMFFTERKYYVSTNRIIDTLSSFIKENIPGEIILKSFSSISNVFEILSILGDIFFSKASISVSLQMILNF